MEHDRALERRPDRRPRPATRARRPRHTPSVQRLPGRATPTSPFYTPRIRRALPPSTFASCSFDSPSEAMDDSIFSMLPIMCG